MNDIKELIRRILLVVIIVYIGFILQMSVFSNLEIAGVTPNILICIVSTFGFMKGQKKGLLIGFCVGIILDLFISDYFGIMALIYTLIGFLNGCFKSLFFGDDLKLPMILIGASDFLYGIMVYVRLLISGGSNNFSFYLMYLILPEVVYTLVVSIFVYYFILKISNWNEQLDKRGSNRFNGTY